jgi:hypothetical protein
MIEIRYINSPKRFVGDIMIRGLNDKKYRFAVCEGNGIVREEKLIIKQKLELPFQNALPLLLSEYVDVYRDEDGHNYQFFIDENYVKVDQYMPKWIWNNKKKIHIANIA